MTTQPAPSAFARASTWRENALPLGGGGFVHVADVEHGQRGQQAEHVKRLLLLGLALDQARGLAVAQQRERAVDEIERLARLLGVLVAPLGFLLQRVDAALQAVEIGQHQLGLDGVDVRDRVDAVVDMGDVGVLEAAHHVRDGIDLADIAEKLVAQAFALRGAAHQPGDVDEGQPCRHDLRGFRQRRKLAQPRIGHRHLADIGLDGAERIVRRLRRRGLGQGVEERRLAHIGQTDDAAFESHDVSSVPFRNYPDCDARKPSQPA